MRVLSRLAVIAFLLLAPTLGRAAPIEELVEERARLDYADSLPDAGHFDISVKDALEGEAVLLADFWMDVPSGRFLANAVLDTGEVQRIGGLALVSVPVPVPARRLMPDSIIHQDDLVMSALPVGRVGAYVVTDPSEVVGKQVRRHLPAGRPIQQQSIIRPLLIDRGERVDIHFSDGLLALVAPGRALDDAHEGQLVRIVNLISNKTVTGIATADGTVEIPR